MIDARLCVILSEKRALSAQTFVNARNVRPVSVLHQIPMASYQMQGTSLNSTGNVVMKICKIYRSLALYILTFICCDQIEK